MLFSVVVPVYQAENFIKKAMDSVINQTFKDYELILVDNGATDNSYKIISDYIDKHPDYDIKCIRLEQNQGISGGRNAGIQSAKGEYISLLDADDIWMSNKLEKTAEAIKNNPSADVLWHYEMREDGNKKTVSKFREVNNSDAFVDLLTNGNCLSPTTVSVRTGLLRDAGGFDTKLDKGQEDYDCWLRLARNGAKFYLIKEPLSSWIVRGDSLSAKHEQHYQAVIEMLKSHYYELEEMGISKSTVEKMWKKRESQMYCFLGRELSLMGDTSNARKYYCKSIAIHPATYKSYAGIVMSYLHI